MTNQQNEQLDFDFDFAGNERTNMLNSARRVVAALPSELGPEHNGAAKGSDMAAGPLELIKQFDKDNVELLHPNVVKLKEEHFAAHGLAVPVQFKTWSAQSNFYWVHFPILLMREGNNAFAKLKYAVEFNSDALEPHLRPKAQTILPNKKFVDDIKLTGSVDLHLGENLEFEVGAGIDKVQLPPVFPGVNAVAGGKAGIDAKVASQIGLVAGPLRYTMQKALIDHSVEGAEKVFWHVEGAQLFQENAPVFVVVLRVPKAVQQVKIDAAVQAYPKFDLTGLADYLEYFSERVANFFRRGAPIPDTRVWDITPAL